MAEVTPAPIDEKAIQKTVHQARTALYQDHDPSVAYQLLYPLFEILAQHPFYLQRMVGELAAQSLFLQKRYMDASRIHVALGDLYMAGYCHLMLGDFNTVQQAWSVLPGLRSNHWGLTLFGMVTQQLQTYPSFLQIRHYIEMDVANLIDAQQMQMVQNLLTYTDLLAQINVEAYKLVGRSLMNSGWLDQALPYLMKGQQVCPQDPEIYYHLGQLSYQLDALDFCRTSLKQCLLMNSSYLPAKELLDRL